MRSPTRSTRLSDHSCRLRGVSRRSPSQRSRPPGVSGASASWSARVVTTSQTACVVLRAAGLAVAGAPSASPALRGDLGQVGRHDEQGAARLRRVLRGVGGCDGVASAMPAGTTATPQLTATDGSLAASSRAATSTSAMARARWSPTSRTANSSPPNRTVTVPGTVLAVVASASAVATMARSPMTWPCSSLRSLRLSMSHMTTVAPGPPTPSRSSSASSSARRLPTPVSGSSNAMRAIRCRRSAMATMPATSAATASPAASASGRAARRRG